TDLLPVGSGANASSEALAIILREGKVDAIVSARPLSYFTGTGSGLKRLFSEADENCYFLRTGIFPILHILLIRRAIHEDQPALATAIVKAFEAAKRKAV